MNMHLTDAPALSWRECLNLSVMSEDELSAPTARHFDFVTGHLEHYLISTPDGRLSVRGEIADDIREATAAGDVQRSGNLKRVLLHFMQLYTAAA